MLAGAGHEEDWDWAAALRICRAVAARYGAGSTDADDVAQDAVLRAWRARASCRARAGRAAWLATIARREALRALERRRPLANPNAVDVEIAAADALDAVEDRAWLDHGLAGLEPRDRALLRLRYQHDLTQQRIAQLSGLPLGTVKVRLHRARARLRSHLEATPSGPTPTGPSSRRPAGG